MLIKSSFVKQKYLNKQINFSEKNSKQDICPIKFVDIHVNEECFFKCKMCFKWKPDLKQDCNDIRISTGDIKKFLVELSNLVEKNFIVSFSGGEPFLKRDLIELFKYSSELGFIPQVNTNGWLIDDNVSRRLVESGLGIINFSVDGITPETHDFIRGQKGSYKRIMDAIKSISHYKKILGSDKPRIIIQTVLSNLNIHETFDMINWVDKNKNIDLLHFNAINKPNNTLEDPFWYKNQYKYLWPENVSYIIKILDHIYEKKKNGSKIGPRLLQIEAYKRYFTNPEKFVKPNECNFDTALYLASNGNMFLCENYDCIGNIRDISLDKAWKSYIAKIARNKIKKCKINCHSLINCNYEE